MSTKTRTVEEEAPLPPIQTSPRGRRSLTSPTSGSTPHRSRPPKPDSSPWNLIMVGFCLGVAGGVGVALGSTLAFLGFVGIGIGTALSLIGVIAEGIRYGARWVSYDQGA